MRSVAIVERRYAAADSAMRRTEPPARPNALNVGMPATGSSSRACSVTVTASAASERDLVASPISAMNSGIGGSVITTVAADSPS